MVNSFFFRNIRAKKSVLRRTRPRPELPQYVLYLGELVGQNQRRVVGPAGEEKILSDKVVESNYKLVSGPEAEDLVKAHWLSYTETERTAKSSKTAAAKTNR
jgi:hypothetical protein